MPLIRHNSTESMASINSLYSQRSFQSTSEVDNNLSISGGKKKRNWLRSSFIKAFNRSKSSSHSSSVNNATNGVYNQARKPNTDVIDITNELGTPKRYSDADDSCKLSVNYSLYSNGNGPYSLPNSPIHQQIALHSNNSNNTHLIQQRYFLF